jgi:alpha-L-fucosidase 2
MRSFAFLLCLTALAQPVVPRLPGPPHDLRFLTPAPSWDEALPLGNGMLGALVWGDGRPLRISLDRADLWDLRLVPEYSGPDYKFAIMRQWHEQGRTADLLRVYDNPYNRPAPTKIPAGRIELVFPGEAQFRETSLTLSNAVGKVLFVDGTSVETFVHAVEPIGMIRIRGVRKPEVRLKAPPFGGQVNEAAAGGIGAGDLAQLGYPAPAEHSGPGFLAYSQHGYGGFRFAVHLAWKDNSAGRTFAWSIASSFESDDPAALSRTRAEKALAQGFEPMLTAHARWWSGFWRQSSVRLPNPVIERQWYLDTYKFGAAARRGAPPITLQAVWTADNGKLPPWKGDYHHDLNTQLSYWPAYSGNHLEDGLGYLDWLWKTRDTAHEWTRAFYEMPGLNVPMTADLNGRQIGGWRQYTHSATTSAWLAQHFWLHWKYSADQVFLKERAYPYVRDVAVFLEAFTAKKDARGYRTHPLSASPEINDNRPSAWFDRTTNYDLALERWVFAAAAEMAAALGRNEDAARWRAVLAEMPPFALGGDGRLLVAPDYPLPASHRHFSHLMAIHPLGLIDVSQGDDARRTIRASLDELERLGPDYWCGYSYAWLASLAARALDGARAERALDIFSTAFTLRSSFHANGDQTGKGYSKFTYRPFTLEGNFAAAAGTQEMLLQSHTGRIVVFPAVPDSWRDVEFHSLRAQGAFLVSARRANGKVTRIEITAERGGRCRLESPIDGKLIEFTLAPGASRTLTY